MADAPGSAGPAHEDPDEPGTGLTTLFEGDWATVRRLRKGKLVVVSGADQGKSVEIAKPRVTGGRSIISDLVVQDKAVSGTHFEVSARDDGYRLRDLNSRNGIFVGDLRIREVFLRPGTVFRIGHTNIQFQTLEDVVEIELSKKDRFDAMLGASPAMREIFAHLEKVAPSDLTCLITGETGTGKEMVARALHNASGRKSRPFVVLDCGSIPRELIESTLFGHEKGSFTGAVGQHHGCFEQAHGGTIFLDEIGELALPLQAKLLRVLQEHEVRPLGATRNQRVDVRIVAATNRNLETMLADGSFREDLYYRLNVIHLDLPPLRARPEDIVPLAEHVLGQLGARQTPPRRMRLSPEAQHLLLAYHWPGNVRELMNVLERGVALCQGELIADDDLPPHVREKRPADFLGAAVARRMTLAELEREFIERVLEDEAGNKTRAAQRLGLDRKTLYRKLDEYAKARGETSAPVAPPPGPSSEPE